jgi:hypothetical protein
MALPGENKAVSPASGGGLRLQPAGTVAISAREDW